MPKRLSRLPLPPYFPWAHQMLRSSHEAIASFWIDGHSISSISERYMKKYLAFAFAALLGGVSLPAAAQECEVTVEGNDAMQFDVNEITVDKTCKEFTVHLKHVGKMPEMAMGHNWVLTTVADMQPVAQEGSKAGLENEYVKPDDERVIAYTEIIGGGETTEVTFDVSKLSADENYTFFCSFPGHWAVMKGELRLAGATSTGVRK